MSIEALNWALEQQTGSPGAKAVLLILANRADHRGRCYPGVDGISEQTEISRRSVIRHIQRLEAENFLEIVHRGGTGEGRKSNEYRLNLARGKVPNWHKGQSAKNAGQCAKKVGQSATVSPEPKDNHQKNPKNPDFESIPNLNPDAWQAWTEYRKRRRLKSYTTTIKAAELASLDFPLQLECVRYSIGNEYAGLFPQRFAAVAAGVTANATDPYHAEIERFLSHAND